MTAPPHTDRGAPRPRAASGPHDVLGSLPPAAGPSDELRRATQAQVDGDLDRAVAGYRAILEQHPGDRAARNNLGLALLQQGRPADALAVLDALGPVESLSSTALTNRANAHLATGDADSAVRLLERAVTLDPASAAWTSLGKARLVAGDVPGAVAALRTAVGRFPGRTDAWRLLGACAAAAGEQPLAIEAFRVVLEQDPDDAAAWRQLSCLLLARSDLGSAVAAARRSVAADPKHPACRRALASALVAIGDPAGAASALDRWLAEAPPDRRSTDEADALAIDRAVLALASGDADTCARLAGDVAEASREHPRAVVTLAQAALTQGDDDGAASLLESVVAKGCSEGERARVLLHALRK